MGEDKKGIKKDEKKSEKKEKPKKVGRIEFKT